VSLAVMSTHETARRIYYLRDTLDQCLSAFDRLLVLRRFTKGIPRSIHPQRSACQTICRIDSGIRGRSVHDLHGREPRLAHSAPRESLAQALGGFAAHMAKDF